MNVKLTQSPIALSPEISVTATCRACSRTINAKISQISGRDYTANRTCRGCGRTFRWAYAPAVSDTVRNGRIKPADGQLVRDMDPKLA